MEHTPEDNAPIFPEEWMTFEELTVEHKKVRKELADLKERYEEMNAINFEIISDLKIEHEKLQELVREYLFAVNHHDWTGRRAISKTDEHELYAKLKQAVEGEFFAAQKETKTSYEIDFIPIESAPIVTQEQHERTRATLEKLKSLGANESEDLVLKLEE